MREEASDELRLSLCLDTTSETLLSPTTATISFVRYTSKTLRFVAPYFLATLLPLLEYFWLRRNFGSICAGDVKRNGEVST